jgi:hypothetical protein
LTNVGEANSYVDCCMNHLSNISVMCVSSFFLRLVESFAFVAFFI